MKVESYTDTQALDFPNIEGVTIRWMVGRKDGAPNFAMRIIEVEPGKQTPFHSHDYEHEVFIVNGRGVIRDGNGEERSIQPGSVAYIAPNEEHGFYNLGEDVMRFICVVPHVQGLEPVLAEAEAVADSAIC